MGDPPAALRPGERVLPTRTRCRASAAWRAARSRRPTTSSRRTWRSSSRHATRAGCPRPPPAGSTPDRSADAGEPPGGRQAHARRRPRPRRSLARDPRLDQQHRRESPQRIAGAQYAFESWSNGGAHPHDAGERRHDPHGDVQPSYLQRMAGTDVVGEFDAVAAWARARSTGPSPRSRAPRPSCGSASTTFPAPPTSCWACTPTAPAGPRPCWERGA